MRMSIIFLVKNQILQFFLILLVLTSCKIQEVQIGKVQNFRFKKIENNEMTVMVDIPVENPNSFGFTLKKIEANLWLNDKEVGKVVQNNKYKIKPKSNQTYTVDLHLKLDKSLQSIPSFIESIMKRKTGVRVEGFVKIQKGLIAKKIKFDHTDKITIFN